MRSQGVTILQILGLLLVACAPEPAPAVGACPPETGGILPLPTRPLGTDPDLTQPGSGQIVAGGANCLPASIPESSTTPLTLTAATPRNETIDIADQQLLAAAVGDDTLALGWLTGDMLHVSLARGGSFLQARPVAPAQAADLVFSPVNRLHLVYEADGQIEYRAADAGTHPADTPFISPVAAGTEPQAALDLRNWGHVIYADDGLIYHALHLYNFFWFIQPLGPGHSPQTAVFFDDPTTTTIEEGGFVLSYLEGSILHLRLYGRSPLRELDWETVTAVPLPSAPLGPVRLHAAWNGAGALLLAAAWVRHEPAPPPAPIPVPPQYMPANPLAPAAVANPELVHAGLNAAGLMVEAAVFDGGLAQQVAVQPGTAVTFSAYGLGRSSSADNPPPANLQMQIGIDPYGGTDPNAGSVVWSTVQSPTGAYSPFVVSTTALTGQVTLFLRARPDAVRDVNAVYWDAAALIGADLTNGDFEEGFINGIPAGWTPFFADGGADGPPPRDRYVLETVWSTDRGATWQGPLAAAENRQPGQGLTGAFKADAYPFLEARTEPPGLHLVAIYETGDPPPETTFLRYGRPVAVRCELETMECADPPGTTLAEATPPASDLVLAPHLLDPNRVLLGWGGLQTDYVSRDVYAVMAALRE